MEAEAALKVRLQQVRGSSFLSLVGPNKDAADSMLAQTKRPTLLATLAWHTVLAPEHRPTDPRSLFPRGWLFPWKRRPLMHPLFAASYLAFCPPPPQPELLAVMQMPPSLVRRPRLLMRAVSLRLVWKRRRHRGVQRRLLRPQWQEQKCEPSGRNLQGLKQGCDSEGKPVSLEV
eukprot:1161902-Pelagomonas_calceolata.AAC.8